MRGLSEAASHAKRLIDTGSTFKVRRSIWDLFNRKQSIRAAFAAANASSQRGGTASDANPVEDRTRSRHAKNTGKGLLSKKDTTKPGLTTTRGRVAGLLSTTKRWLRSNTLQINARVAKLPRCSFITKTRTARIQTRIILKGCANDATNWSISACAIFQRWSYSRQDSVLYAATTTLLQDLAGIGASNAGNECEGIVSARAKAGSYALNYGMKEKKLARSLHISEDEAKAIIERYLDTYPAIRGFYASAIADAQQTGYSTTLLGRRRVHKAINSYNTMDRWSEERKAVNNNIQGTAADAVRLAMINLSRANLDKKYGCMMLLQIHDELMFECPEETADEAMKEIKQIMEHPFPTDLIVPLDVSIGKGPNWAAAK